MKVRLPVAVLFTAGLLLVSPVQAQYTGPSATVGASVEEILKSPVDDQDVQLTGHILRKVSSEGYIFSDGTAEILAEIKSKRFEGMAEINDKTKVEIFGEVDTSRFRAPEIEVDRIRIVQ